MPYLKEKTGDISVLETKSIGGKTIKNGLDDLLAKVGEKIEFKRAAYFSSNRWFLLCI